MSSAATSLKITQRQASRSTAGIARNRSSFRPRRLRRAVSAQHLVDRKIRGRRVVIEARGGLAAQHRGDVAAGMADDVHRTRIGQALEHQTQPTEGLDRLPRQPIVLAVAGLRWRGRIGAQARAHETFVQQRCERIAIYRRSCRIRLGKQRPLATDRGRPASPEATRRTRSDVPRSPAGSQRPRRSACPSGGARCRARAGRAHQDGCRRSSRAMSCQTSAYRTEESETRVRLRRWLAQRPASQSPPRASRGVHLLQPAFDEVSRC